MDWATSAGGCFGLFYLPVWGSANPEPLAQPGKQFVSWAQLWVWLLLSEAAVSHDCLACLLSPQVGARLISHAGSLTNLAKYPASTVQILGAEKALFRYSCRAAAVMAGSWGAGLDVLVKSHWPHV